MSQPQQRMESRPAQFVVGPLAPGHRDEALAFLAERPVDNVIMSGFIRDHGVVSPQNRGVFFGCRDRAGTLAGVALVGHGVAFDSRAEAATELFAALARRTPDSRLLMGERDQVRAFWGHYAAAGAAPRKLREVTILEQREPFAGCEEIAALRPARAGELAEVASLHAEMVREENGEDPLATEPESFRQRCLRRIERGRTWVWFDGGRIVYKADVIAETPEAAYVEGVYVHPHERRKGHGRRCLAEMSRRLLARSAAVCLFADEENRAARGFYESAGYLPSGRYNILYF